MSDVTLSTPGAASRQETTRRVGRYARYVFWLMFVINFLNYLDRWIFTGLGAVIQQDLHIDDFQVGLLASGFLIVYTIVALPLGFLAERVARKLIVGVGVAIWSVATVLTGVVGGFLALLGVRAILGIGEGSYYPAGTPLLAAYFPPARRARVLSRWAVGALIGAAVGFLLAAPFATPHAWRYAFFFTGIPGLIFAFLMLRVREKSRHEEDPTIETLGAIPAVATGDLTPTETPAAASASASASAPSMRDRVRAYLRIPTFRTIFGMHALGFFALTSVTSFATIYLNDTYGKVGPTRDKYGKLLDHPGPGAFPHSGLGSALVPILAGGVVL
ncbi:MAG TPA: MFS transporter, partial [Ktedonobacterales bacterium]|nr:MFS transporter [Ktedonobacterales bacterium]